MDAIESGIMELPRIPVSDNVPNSETLIFRNLWDHIGKHMPKAGARKSGKVNPRDIPPKLQTALNALYGHTRRRSTRGRGGHRRATTTSQLVYEWIAGYEREV